MNQHGLIIRCLNCGNEWSPAEELEAYEEIDGATCPLCQYSAAERGIAPQASFSIDELESQLSHLITAARASGIAPNQIIRVLRDELEFTAELANAGRHISVQLIDLGPQTLDLSGLAQQDRREVLTSRAIGR